MMDRFILGRILLFFTLFILIGEPLVAMPPLECPRVRAAEHQDCLEKHAHCENFPEGSLAPSECLLDYRVLCSGQAAAAYDQCMAGTTAATCPPGYKPHVEGGVTHCDPDDGVQRATSSGLNREAGDKSGPGATERAASTPQTNTANNATPPLEQAQVNGRIAELELEIEQCEARRKKAEQCCTKPETCIGDAVGAGGGASSTVLQAIQLTMAGATMLSGAGGDIARTCATMGTVSQASMVLNTAMAGTCTASVSQCNGACDDLKERLKALYDQTPTVLADQRTKIGTLRQDVAKKVDACSTYNNTTVRAGMQAMASWQAAQSAKMCQEQAGGGGLDNFGENQFNIDCNSPMGVSNAACQQRCSRADAANDPSCARILAQNANFNNKNGGGRRGGPGGPGGPGGNGPPIIDIGPDNEDPQVPPIGQGLQAANGLNQMQGGGAAGIAFGGGDFGGGGGPGGAGGGGLRIDPNILKGTSSGNGYSQQGGLRGGSGGGYSQNFGGRDPASTGQKFSLKDFLPGGKMAPKRGLAGMVGGNPEIGSKTDDIFKRISGRFYQLCLQDRLYDCSTLRGMKRGP